MCSKCLHRIENNCKNLRMKLTLFLCILALSNQEILAQQFFGPFSYTDDGESISIDNYNDAGFGENHVVIPAFIDGKPVRAIGPSAFSSNVMRGVSIPSSVTKIGSRAFADCLNLSTFQGCRSLKSVLLPAKLVEIEREAFSATGIEKITIPKSIKTIGRGIFSDCNDLRTVDFKAELSEIPDSMFRRCFKLARLDFPPTVRRIGPFAFYDSGLKTLDLKSVSVIGKQAFYLCEGLFMVKMPDNIKQIEVDAFALCLNLESVVFPDSVPQVGLRAFQATSPDFKVFFSSRASGYTLPRWQGYPSSLPDGEIAVRIDSGPRLSSDDETKRIGTVVVGKKGISKRFIIHNVGNRKLDDIKTAIRGRDASEFKVKNLSRSSLNSGEIAIFEIVFEPKVKGKRTCRLEISSSDANENPFIINLSGIALQLVE
jgi:BspA type Leucine rich repeat region (6 copies)